MNIDDLIKKETTLHKEQLWGEDYEIAANLIDHIHGNGKLLIYIQPLATRPRYYIMRVDSKVKRMIEKDTDDSHELIESFLEYIEDQCGFRVDEDEDGEIIYNPWPALNDTCGWSWGTIE
jgi:hypothetical protein